jgi:hypothetical protein
MLSQSIKMMIVVVVVYALCWMPLHVVTLLGDMRPSIWNYEHIQPVWIGSYWLAMSSCCWNPIIYCWKNDTFRAGFQYALLGRCPCRSLRRRSCHLFDKQPAFSPSMAAAAAPFCLAPRVRNANWSSASAACGRPRLSRAAAARVARGGSIRIIAAQVARVGVPSTSSSVGGYACVESVLAKSNPVSLPLSVDGGGELDETGLTNTGRKPIFRQAAETGLNRSKPKVRGAKNRGRQLCRPSLTRKLNYQTTTTTKTLP